MHYKKYLQEFEEKSYSDVLKSTDDIMYSNARAMEIYGRGKRFDIADNLILYEVVKIVRDTIDKHFYQNSVKFSIQIADREAHFTFIVGKEDAKYSYFLETLFMYITNEIYRTYGNYFNIDREEKSAGKNKVKLKIIVKKNEEV